VRTLIVERVDSDPAQQRQAAICRGVKSGYSAMMVSAVPPAAKQPRMRLTGILVPLIRGFPCRISGSLAIQSFQSTSMPNVPRPVLMIRPHILPLTEATRSPACGPPSAEATARLPMKCIGTAGYPLPQGGEKL
jgi:hypothetical protein